MNKKNVLLVGVTGSGKSSLGNLLLGDDIFKVSDATNGVTTDGSVQTTNMCPFNIGDTQGLNDPNDSQALVRSRISAVIKQFPKGIDIFCVVVKMERFVKATADALNYLFEGVLGNGAYANCILVLTHCASKYVMPSTKDQAQLDWLKKAKEVELLQELIEKVSHRVVFVANPFVDPEEDPSEQKRCQGLKNLSKLELVKTLEQFSAKGPYLNAAALKAQVKHDEALRQKAESEKKSAEAKFVEQKIDAMKQANDMREMMVAMEKLRMGQKIEFTDTMTPELVETLKGERRSSNTYPAAARFLNKPADERDKFTFPFPFHPHPLKHETKNQVVKCDGCTDEDSVGSSYHCKVCRFSLCPMCGSNHETRLKQHEHWLVWTPPAFRRYQRYQCNICKSSKAGASFWCKECEFDACIGCARDHKGVHPESKVGVPAGSKVGVPAGSKVVSQPASSVAGFPVGECKAEGSYTQNGTKYRMVVNRLYFLSGAVRGWGNDSVGVFSIQGSYEPSLTFRFYKRYDSHIVDYEGRLESGRRLTGTWTLKNMTGSFELTLI